MAMSSPMSKASPPLGATTSISGSTGGVVVVVVDVVVVVVDVVVVVVVEGGAAPSTWNGASDRSMAAAAATSISKSPATRSAVGVQVTGEASAATSSAIRIRSPSARSVTQWRVPWSRLHSSAMRSVQIPAASTPSNTDRSWSGRNEPANGARPSPIERSALSLNTVRLAEQSAAPEPKLLRQPPWRSASLAEVPSGATNSMTRSPA